MTDPTFNTDLGQYVATVNGYEVYGNTWSECLSRAHDKLRVQRKHIVVNGLTFEAVRESGISDTDAAALFRARRGE